MNRKPRLLLIDVVDGKLNFPSPPLNLICLASYLTKNEKLKRENIRIVNSSSDDVLGIVDEFKPDIIGFSTVTPFYNLTLELAKKIRNKSNAILVLGGYHITALPNYLEKPFDMGVVGEGEYSLSLLVKIWEEGKIHNTQELSNIPNLVYFNKSGELIQNKSRKVLEVNELTEIDWKLIPKQRVVSQFYLPINGRYESRKMTLLYTARGCPYNCSFCAHRVMTFGKKGVRFYPLELVLNEILFLYQCYGITCIQILDDTFAVSKKRIRLMIDGLKKHGLLGKICFYNAFVRANLIDNEFSNLLKKLGVVTVFMGVESGSEKMLKKLKDGPISPKIVETAVDSLGKAGIYVVASFMLFSPNESKSDFKKSINLAKLLVKKDNLFSVSLSVTTPYPGTKLWTDALESGVVNIKKPNWEEFLMLHLDDVKKIPRVFYQPRWADKEKMQILWSTFVDISDIPKKRLEKIIERTDKLTISTSNMNKRWKRLIKNPIRSLTQILKNPKIFLWIAGDLKTIFWEK